MGIIAKYIDIQPSEEKNFRLLFIQSLLTGFSTSFFFVVCSTFFIQHVNISNLPSAYILSGLLGYMLITIYKRQQRRNGIGSSFLLSLFAYALLCVILYALHLYVRDGEMIKMIAYAGFMFIMPFSTILALGFATVCVRIFNISQSKRLLALIGTGEVLASILAYLLVPLLSKVMEPVHLLLLSVITTLGAIVPLRMVYAHNKEQLALLHSHVAAKKFDLSFFTKNKYYLLISVATVLSITAVFFTDYAYLISVRYISKESGYKLAAVVAIVFSIIKAGELTFSLLSGKIIRSLSMKYALLLLPWLLIFFSFMAFMSGLAFSTIPFFMLFFLLLNKWSERAIRKGVLAPSMKVLFQVAPAADRTRLQTNIDGTVTQVASIFAGALLWVISTVFKDYDSLALLRVVAVVCLVAFTLWGLVTSELYKYYRSVIIDFLNSLSSKKKRTQVAGVEEREAVEAMQSAISDAGCRKMVNEILYEIPFDKAHLQQWIFFYNDTSKLALVGNEVPVKHLERAYYSNENFFSRVLIVWYTMFLPKGVTLNFIKEFYSVSCNELRLQMIAALNKSGYRIGVEDRFYFTSMCQDVVAEIVWTEAAIRDIGDNNELLTQQLSDHIQLMKDLLFEVLKVLYEAAPIQVIEDIINEKARSFEDQLFALELLDITLDPDMKKWILPIFEDISFVAKKNRLKNVFVIYSLPYEEKLKEIIMKDFKLMGNVVKQTALEGYYKHTNDMRMLNAFASSNIEPLNATANALKNSSEEHMYSGKLQVADSLNLANVLQPVLLSYLLTWGIVHNFRNSKSLLLYQTNNDHLHRLDINHRHYAVDVLGLALLMKMQENEYLLL